MPPTTSQKAQCSFFPHAQAQKLFSNFPTSDETVFILVVKESRQWVFKILLSICSLKVKDWQISNKTFWGKPNIIPFLANESILHPTCLKSLCPYFQLPQLSRADNFTEDWINFRESDQRSKMRLIHQRTDLLQDVRKGYEILFNLPPEGGLRRWSAVGVPR